MLVSLWFFTFCLLCFIQKNPWEKITENISLKASDVLGAKDVSRMKESILNKKADLAAAVTKN